MELTFEDAKFIDMLVNVFTRQLDGIESMVTGVDLSDARIKAIEMRKKVRSVQPPKPQEAPNVVEAKADATGAGKEPAPEAAKPA